MANRPRPDRKEERRVEATERNEAWRKLTKDQQIRSLEGRRGLSKKQLARIEGKS